MIKYNLALIGYGYWGPKLARNIQNSNKFKISYIIDNSRKNLDLAKKDFPLAKQHKDYKSLDKSNIDLVVISTPTKTHYEMANYFLKSTNVLIEKPLLLQENFTLSLPSSATSILVASKASSNSVIASFTTAVTSS